MSQLVELENLFNYSYVYNFLLPKRAINGSFSIKKVTEN